MSLITSLIAYIPIRAEATHRAEMVSQLLFGETANILQETKEWIEIETTFDKYKGWVEKEAVHKIIQPKARRAYVHDLLSKVYSSDSHFWIPAGSEIPIDAESKEKNTKETDNFTFMLAGQDFEIETLPLRSAKFEADHFINSAKEYLHTPYLWGGRTCYGIDCSGFIQVVFKIHGISLPRDASQQVKQGQSVNALSEALPGDLLFFGDLPEKITHVGIYSAPNAIIHASKKVRIDTVDETGIFSRELQKITHKLQYIRRVIPS